MLQLLNGLYDHRGGEKVPTIGRRVHGVNGNDGWAGQVSGSVIIHKHMVYVPIFFTPPKSPFTSSNIPCLF